MKDQTKILEAGRLRQSLAANMLQTCCAWTVEDNNLRLGGTDDQAKAKAEIHAVQPELKACG